MIGEIQELEQLFVKAGVDEQRMHPLKFRVCRHLVINMYAAGVFKAIFDNEGYPGFRSIIDDMEHSADDVMHILSEAMQQVVSLEAVPMGYALVERVGCQHAARLMVPYMKQIGGSSGALAMIQNYASNPCNN